MKKVKQSASISVILQVPCSWQMRYGREGNKQQHHQNAQHKLVGSLPFQLVIEWGEAQKGLCFLNF
jgi:hypothetical protein